MSSRVYLKIFLKIFCILFFVYIFYLPKVFLKEILRIFFEGCFVVARAVFSFRRNAFTFYADAESYANKMHSLCSLPSGVKKISFVFCR